MRVDIRLIRNKIINSWRGERQRETERETERDRERDRETERERETERQRERRKRKRINISQTKQSTHYYIKIQSIS